MNESIFVDTSAWFALVDKRDDKHPLAHQFLTQEKSYGCVTTNYIIDETLTLTSKKMGREEAFKIGQKLYAGQLAQVVQVTEDLQLKALDLIRQYHDKFFSFTDCTSFLVMKHLSIRKALSFDSDFKKAGFISLP